MEATHTYQIEIEGRLSAGDLHTMSPLPVTAVRVEPQAIRFAVCTDPSGLIGLLRHLHARGLALLAVYRLDGETLQERRK